MKKNTKPKSKKKILVVVGVAVAIYLVIVGVAWAYYQSQRPNYRDLEKAFNELNIPEDWQEVSSSKNEGTWGLFCWQIEGETCPYLTQVFSRTNQTQDNIDILLNEVKNNFINSGYTIKSFSNEKCRAEYISSIEYSCSIIAAKNNIEVYYDVRGSDQQGQPGSFATIVVSPVSN